MTAVIQGIGILLLIIGGAMAIYPGYIWWGIIVAIIGIILAAYDWVKTQK